MNIFVISDDPVVCASALDDLRLNKMIIETAQLLCTAMISHGYVNSNIYKTTHLNHPCAVWTRQTEGNFRWLVKYFDALNSERENRTGKTHASYIKIWPELCNGWQLIPKGNQTPFVNCSYYKYDVDVFNAYKETLKMKWTLDKRSPKWTNTTKPSWAT